METVVEKSFKSNFGKKSRLDTNMLSSGFERKKTFRCEICGKSVTTNKILAKHIGEIHEGKKPFKCEICDYYCSRKGDMNACDYICDYSCS